MPCDISKHDLEYLLNTQSILSKGGADVYVLMQLRYDQSLSPGGRLNNIT